MVKLKLIKIENWVQIYIIFFFLHCIQGAEQINPKNIEKFNLAVKLLDTNIEKSVFLLKNLSELGDPNGMCLLAELYLEGTGVEKDETKAIKLLKNAAQKNSANALNCIGVLYNKGQGFKKDGEKANTYFLKAAKMGHELAQYNIAKAYNLGTNIEKDLVEAVYWYKKSAAQGYVNSQVELGKLYSETQPKESFRWIQRAADSGHPTAQFQTGKMYLTGKATPLNPINAFEYFQLAANQNHPKSILEIGLMLYEGYGTERNQEKGVEMVKRAINLGEKHASQKLRRLSLNEFDFLLNLNSASKGDTISMINLGWNYLKGKQLTRDKTESYAWFNLAALTSGNQKHIWARDYVAEQLSIQELITAKKRAKQIELIYGTKQ